LRKIDGTLSEFKSYVVDKIMEDAISLDISRVKKAFPLVAQGGLIGILVGMDHLDESSRKHGRGQN
jgi:hypothetical protein